MVINIINCYPGNLMSHFQDIRIHVKYFSQEVIHKYNLHSIMDKHGYVHVESPKGMYVIKYSGIVTYKRLV